MAINRYLRSPVLAFGQQFGTSEAHLLIRDAISSGILPYKEHVMQIGQRLDAIAGAEYGDSGYYWIIAAASEIGWALQVPPGTLLKIPSLKEALKIIS